MKLETYKILQEGIHQIRNHEDDEEMTDADPVVSATNVVVYIHIPSPYEQSCKSQW